MPTSTTFEALCEAMDDEFKARATYLAVIDKLGPQLPFVHIVQSEQRHIEALAWLFDQYGWTPPSDRWLGKVVSPDTLAEACQVGVQAEIENVELYDRLMDMAEDERVRVVFKNLRHASRACHLPAFQRFLDGENAAVCGSEAGRRHAHGICCGRRDGFAQGRCST